MSDPAARFACPCCGLYTLSELPPGSHEICRLCGWEDDRVQNEDPLYRGGANHQSLIECRLAFFSRGETGELIRQRLDQLPRGAQFGDAARREGSARLTEIFDERLRGLVQELNEKRSNISTRRGRCKLGYIAPSWRFANTPA